MALNFPLNPSDGDTYEGYVYDATAGVWNANQGQIVSRFSTSATQPNSPTAGDGWLNPANGKTYVYYDGYWIESGNPVIGGVEPYDKTTVSTGFFALPKGTTAQRPDTPQNGDIRFNTTLGEPEYYSEDVGEWFLFREAAVSSFEVSYLVVAGGGGGGAPGGGGGGAGGYRTNSGTSGGGASAESLFNVDGSTQTQYTVTVGAGGAGGVYDSLPGYNGGNSVFASVTSLGGGGGGGNAPAPTNGGSGGGDGGAGSASGGSGTSGQGYAGGSTTNNPGYGGGGGAGAAGANGSNVGGPGGVGVSSSITGSSVYYAGGGGAGCSSTGSGAGAGGLGGGGAGSFADTNATAGTASTGGGGGGRGNGSLGGAAGGSGIVILKYPSTKAISVGDGLTYTTSTVGNYKVTTFTAGSDTVTFS